MSKVSYKVGEKEYHFTTTLQIANLLAVETCLIEEIKKDKLKNEAKGMMKDITIEDDNHLVAFAKNFEEIGTLTIIKH